MPKDEKKPGASGSDTEADDEDKEKALDERINKSINSAVTAHLRRFRTDMEKLITDAVAGSTAELLKQVKPPDEQKPGDKAKPDDEAGKQIKALQARLDAAEKARGEEKSAREQERAQRLRGEERDAAVTVFRKAGMDEPRIRGALAILHTEDKRIVRKDDGTVGYRAQRAGFEEIIDLEVGIGDWLKTDEGKAYMPPKGAAGSGSGRGVRAHGNETKNQVPTRREVGEALLNVLDGEDFGE